MQVIVDRIENDIVMIELPDGQTVNIPRVLVPDAAEGDVYVISKDTTETESRRDRITQKMNRLFID
ncbi:MAG: DUF3006 domain-containing protein [Peptococcaceae bacterium]|nr:DUF3006 domain-containing protein [Peptococcaceae bacterium]